MSVQLVVLVCANHGCDVVEDGDGNEGSRVSPVDAAAGIGTGENQQGGSEGDEAPAIGAYVVQFEICVVSVPNTLGGAAGAVASLTGRLQVRFDWGAEPWRCVRRSLGTKAWRIEGHTANDHQRVPDATESS